MSDPMPPDMSIDINVLPQIVDKIDNSARLEKLIKNREILYMGERDSEFRETIFLEEAFRDMIQFGMTDRTIEKAGAIRGFHQDGQTIITGFIGLDAAHASGGSVAFDANMWADAQRENDINNANDDANDLIMGWFHTHPRDFAPAPLTAEDRFIMSEFFQESGKNTPDDRTTFIMTTQSNNPAEIVAAWKWDKENNRAVLLRGFGIAKNTKDPISAIYFSVGDEERNVIGQISEVIKVSKEDMPDKDGKLTDVGVTVDRVENDQVLKIQLDDISDEVLRLNIEDLGQEEVLKLDLDDVTPNYAQALIKHLNKNPDGKSASLIRKILEASQKVMPPTIANDIDLVLKQSKSTIDQINIIS